MSHFKLVAASIQKATCEYAARWSSSLGLTGPEMNALKVDWEPQSEEADEVERLRH